jgi:hypothetical protein
MVVAAALLPQPRALLCHASDREDRVFGVCCSKLKWGLLEWGWESGGIGLGIKKDQHACCIDGGAAASACGLNGYVEDDRV